VTLTVNVVNDAPVGVADSYSVNEDGTLTIAAAQGVLANDTDAEGTTLTASVVANPTNGTLTLNADGSFTYTPAANFNGTDTFTYAASDGSAQSAATTVTIAVNSQADAPTANDDTFNVANDGAAEMLSVLANDTSNPDAGQTLTITAVTQGSNGGTVSFTGTTLSYTPASGFVGTETFTYTIRDTDNLTDTATVTVTVTEAAGNSVLGFVYIDGNGNGVRDGGELGVPGAVITLTGIETGGDAVSMTAISASDGSYRFDDLTAGTYQLSQGQPHAMLDGAESSTASAAGIVTGSDQFTNIVLSGAITVGELNFGERGLRPEYVSMRMFLASTPPQDVMLRETIALGEELAGNTSLAETIRNGGATSDPTNSAPLAVADSYAVATGGTLTVPAASGVLHNDVDGDGDTLTALAVTQPASGMLSLAADGSFTYTPNSGFTGNDSFTYTASDGTATSNTVTVTINVHATTNAPVAVVDSYVVNRNETLTVDAAGGLLANDSDAENDTLTAQVATQPTNGTLTLNADGSFTYTPNSGFVGTDTFTYQANDGTASSTAVTVSISVLNTNVAPTTAADTYATTGVLTVNAAQGVLANDSDSNGDTITASLFAQATNGTVSLLSDGSFTYTPNAGFAGTDTFSYTASDGSATSNVTTVTITVNAAMDNVFALAENSPNGTIVGQITPPSSATGALLYDFLSTVTATPSHLQLAADDHLIGDPSAPVVLIEYLDFQCPVCLTYHPVIEQLIDEYEGELLVVQRHFPLNTPHPNAFEAAQAAEAAGRQGKFHEYGNLLFDNQDEWESLSDPTSFFEQYATELGLNLAQFQSDIQDPAIAARINRDLDVAEDMNFSGTPTFFLNGQEIDVAADFTDFADLVDDELADVDNMFFVDRQTGEITVANSAALDFETSGPFTLGVNVREVDGTQSTVTVTINLTDVNEAPTAAADTYSTNRDVPLTVAAGQGVLANDSDVDGDTLSSQLVAAPTSGTLTLGADGSFTYTPNAGFAGSDSFTYQASDGSHSSTTTTVSITVNDTNTGPVAVADAYSVDENAALNVDAANGVLDNDTDINADALTAVLVATTTNGTLTLNPNGSFSYQPNQDFTGTDTFTYVANDGLSDSESVVVTVTVAALNAAPVSVADAYMVAQNETLHVNAAGGVLANDTDANSDPLTAQIVTQTANGTVTLNADGSFTYTPNSGFTGSDSFTYRANDGQADSNTSGVSITVTASNTFAVAESAGIDAIIGQVVAPSGFGPGVRFEIVEAGLPSQLQLAVDDHFTGDPAASVVLIEYMDLSCPHCRDIHPVVEDLLEDFDGELLVVRRHLLLFDSSTSSFVFPNSLAAARAAEAAARQGKFDEMVDKLFDNQDAWRSASDPSTFFNQYAQEIGLNLTQFASDQADPAIDERINRDRTAASALGLASTPSFFINGQQTSNPGTLEAFTPLIINAFIDADEPVAIDRETGQLFVNDPGALDASTAPTIQFNVVIADASGAKQTVSVTVNVHAANSAPAAANDGYNVAVDGSLAIDAVMGLLANDFDADGDALAAQLISGPTSGTLTLNANGSFTYTPNAGFSGNDSFTYVAKDSVAMSLQATARITVGSPPASAAAIEADASAEDEESSAFDGELVDAVMQEEEEWGEA
jgi:VCBS repeat-containing protein